MIRKSRFMLIATGAFGFFVRRSYDLYFSIQARR